MRLIDADVLAEIFSDRMEKIAERYGVYSSESGILSGAYTLLQSQPTIEPRKGKWVEIQDDIFAPIVVCSNCGQTAMVEDGEYQRTRYCSNCGAQMTE